MDDDACYRALAARDRRFDGLFFVGVSTTGVYCRPVCSARTPGRDRCSFFRHPAQAERAGYRACFRCRPELAPGRAPLDSVPRLVGRAVARIEEGCLDESSIEVLASSLGVTSRHLRRAMEAELGVTPVELAQSRRLAIAKRLLHDTTLPLADVAFSSGFGSVRRFNAAFRQRLGRRPSDVRRHHGAGGQPGNFELRLDFRPPLDWDAMLAFFGPRAVAGVEIATAGAYRRTVKIGDAAGIVTVRRDPERPALIASASVSLAPVLGRLVRRLRAAFDLDAEPRAVSALLARDRLLSPLVRRAPGLRVPGAFDPFEAAVRAVLGQQVSVRAATTLAGRLVERFGARLEGASDDALSRVFPGAEDLARATTTSVAAIGLPASRAATLCTLAERVASGRLDLTGATPPADTISRLEELPGVGSWTAQYVAMRALRFPDAFPAGDLGVRKALGGLAAKEAERRAEAWRPWRSYAVLHLWRSLEQRG